MSAWLLPLGATVAAGAITYWCCVRPMLHRRQPDTAGCCAPTSHTESDSPVGEQIRQARRELAQLQADANRPANQTRVEHHR